MGELVKRSRGREESGGGRERRGENTEPRIDLLFVHKRSERAMYELVLISQKSQVYRQRRRKECYKREEEEKAASKTTGDEKETRASSPSDPPFRRPPSHCNRLGTLAVLPPLPCEVRQMLPHLKLLARLALVPRQLLLPSS